MKATDEQIAVVEEAITVLNAYVSAVHDQSLSTSMQVEQNARLADALTALLQHVRENDPLWEERADHESFTPEAVEPPSDGLIEQAKKDLHISEPASVDVGMEELKPRINSRALEILDDLKLSAYFAELSNERLFDALSERIDEPSPLGTESPEMKAILCELASRLPDEPEVRQEWLDIAKQGAEIQIERMRAEQAIAADRQKRQKD